MMKRTSDSQPQYVKIAAEIRSRILSGEWAPGFRLPSQQEMIGEYGIALGTVRQVLKELRVSGLVRSRRGQGTFVNDSTHPAAHVGLAFIGLPVGDLSIPMDSVLDAQQYLADRRIGLTLAGFRVDQGDELAAWASRLQGVLLYGLMTRDLISRLLTGKTPVAVVGAVQDGACPSGAAQVAADTDGCMTLALEFLAGQGHRRVCLVNRSISNYYREVGLAFRQAAAEMGLAAYVTEVITDETADEAALVARVKGIDPAPTALLVEGGRRACRLMPLLAEAGWHVPDRMSIMAINGRPAHDLFYPELSRMDLDWRRMMQRAADAIIESMGSGRVVREQTGLRLVWGRTVKPAAPSGKEVKLTGIRPLATVDQS